MSADDSAQLEAALRGKTLLVYWYLLRRGGTSIGVRELQRALGFTSPSVSFHHLEKLAGLGLVRKNEQGEYTIVEEVKVGIFRNFVRVGALLLPRYTFYAVLVTSMLIAYVALYPQTVSVDRIVAIMFGGIASLILWYETIRLWKQAPG